MEHIAHLSKDKNWRRSSFLQKPVRLQKKKHVHLALVGSITSQQLSTKVAVIIQQRFHNLFDLDVPTCERYRLVPFDTLRGIGLSNAKQIMCSMSAVFHRRKTHRCCTAWHGRRSVDRLPDQDQRRGPLDQQK